MKFLFYLQEIQYRLFIIFYSCFVNFIILYFNKEEVIYLLGQHQDTLFPYFIATNLTEIFFSYIKLDLFLAFYLTYPLIILQLWFFIRPGLYQYENKVIYNLILITIILYIITTVLTYNIFLPYCWKFFTGFEFKAENYLVGIHLETRLNDYLDFFIKVFLSLNLLFHFFICFILILKKLKLDFLIYYRKVIYLWCFIIATIATPPDIISQIFLGGILILFYETFLLSFFVMSQYKRANNGIRTRNFQSHNLTL